MNVKPGISLLHLVVTFVLFALVSSTSFENPVCAFQVTVENHQAGSTIRYPVVLLRGTAGGDFAKLKIKNENPREGGGDVRPVLHDGKFKALVELSTGENVIKFMGEGNSSFEFKINYKPQTNPYYVRIVWMTDNTGETKFAVPDDSVPQNYEARLRTAAELMQTFTAEKMQALGYGRKTFRLERDEKGQVIVHTFACRHRAEHYHQMHDQKWWQDVRQWINNKHFDPKAKNMVLAAFTRKDEKTGKMKSHTALGGGNLGLFGSASVFAWPQSIELAGETFLDSSTFDKTKVHDDSVGRSNIWGLASTTLGATLHEMGHTFGLMHVKDPKGIMSRGFDHFHRSFTFSDPPSARNKKAIYHEFKAEARFAPISASRLQWSKWFQLDKRPDAISKRLELSYDLETESFLIKSSAGIPWVGLMTGGFDVVAYKEYTDRPTEVVLTLKEAKELVGGAKITRVTVIDADGNEGRAVFDSRE